MFDCSGVQIWVSHAKTLITQFIYIYMYIKEKYARACVESDHWN